MLTLTNLTKDYGNGQGLHDVSVSFPEHQTTVIVGPSGSGKTTLLRTLDLLETADSGRFQLDDLDYDLSRPLTKAQVLAVRRKLSVVFQSYNLFPHLSVLANITEGPVHVQHREKATVEEEARILLRRMNLEALADAYPDQLSGGQQQRIAIARMVAMQPEYMLFDEPTSALDPELEVSVLNVILGLAKAQNSIVIVTHNMAFAEAVADRIVFVENGQIAYAGAPKAFFTADAPRIRQFLQAGTFGG